MFMHRLARPLLAAIFVIMGIETLRNPKFAVETARPKLELAVAKTGDSLPEQVPTDPETLVKLSAAVKVGAGAMLALGKFPRLAALVLAADLVPTTLAGHPYWENEDPAQRMQNRVHFLKNLGLIGGLLATAFTPSRHRSE